MPAQRYNIIWKSWAFVQLYVCYKYKNNHLYHVSKEDVKWLSYLGVEYYLSCWVLFWEFLGKKIKLTEQNLSHKDIIKKKTLHYHFQGARLKTSLDNNKKIVSKWVTTKHFSLGVGGMKNENEIKDENEAS